MKERGTPSPYAVLCNHDLLDEGGKEVERVYLTLKQYDQQMSRPDSTWRCPLCCSEAAWDDENFERSLEQRDISNLERMCKGMEVEE